MSNDSSVKNGPAPAKPFSPYRWSGKTLYTSGQVGTDPRTEDLAGEATPDQARQALANLSAVLKGAGLGPADLVKVNIYLVDMGDYAAVNEVYVGFFEGCPELPARTCVQVAALPLGARIEIEGLARKHDTD